MVAWFLIAIATIGFFAFIAISAGSTTAATGSAASRAETIQRINSVVEALASKSAAPFADGIVYAPAGQATNDGYLLPIDLQPRGITSFGTKFIYCPVGAPLTSSNQTVQHAGGSYRINVAAIGDRSFVTQSNLSIASSMDPNVIGFVLAPIDRTSTVGGCNQITASNGSYSVPNGIVRALNRNRIAELDSTMSAGGTVWHVTTEGQGSGASWSDPANLNTALAAYRASSGGSFTIRVADGTYRIGGNPLDQNSNAISPKGEHSILTINAPGTARLNLGNINVPSDLYFNRVLIDDGITYVQPGRKFYAQNANIGGIVALRGASVHLTSSVEVRGKPGTSGAINLQEGSSLNTSAATITIRYLNGIPALNAAPGSKTVFNGSTISLEPQDQAATSKQTYGMFFATNSQVSAIYSSIHANGQARYSVAANGSFETEHSDINSNAASDVALFSDGGDLSMENITIAGSRPAGFALYMQNSDTVSGNGDFYSTWKCWNRTPTSPFRYSTFGVTGLNSRVYNNERDTYLGDPPTAQQVQDFQGVRARNADRELLRNSVHATTAGFNCRAAAGVTSYTKCADENGYCSLPFYTTVRFGAGNSWVYQENAGGLLCNVQNFGDPLPGQAKICQYATE